jgi:extracellular factor (EF) 3-hydroxypalmitic acid methyl ester biosynthesis protein
MNSRHSDRTLTENEIPVQLNLGGSMVVPAVIKDFSKGGLRLRTRHSGIKLDNGLLGVTNKKYFHRPFTFEKVWSNDDLQSMEIGVRLVETEAESQFYNVLNLMDRAKKSVSEGRLLALSAEYISLIFKTKTVLSNIFDFLNEIESETSIEVSESRIETCEQLQQVIFPEFRKVLSSYSAKLQKFFLDSDVETRKVLKDLYRKEVAPFFIHSPFVRRANEKPLGYAGDFQMMKQIYEMDYSYGSFFSRFCQYYSLNEEGSFSVRFRKSFLKSKLLKATKSDDKIINVLSVASGPACEIVEWIDENSETLKSKHFNISLVDKDLKSLQFAKKRIVKLIHDRGLSNNIRIFTFNESIVSIIRNKSELNRRSLYFHLVYSAGLYDYLEARIAKALTSRLETLVKLGGALVIGNFYIKNRSQALMDFACDWVLIHRSEQDMRQLFSSDQITLACDPSESQIFATRNFDDKKSK